MLDDKEAVGPQHDPNIDEKALEAPMRQAADSGRPPGYEVPDRYLLVEEIPKTSVGKLDKKVVRQQYFQSPASPLSAFVFCRRGPMAPLRCRPMPIRLTQPLFLHIVWRGLLGENCLERL